VSSNVLPDKLFFKIGEVAQIVGVRAHVLRYWESEFGALRPLKTRGSHRVYRRRDVELAVLLRRLLHEEGLTIAGAKRRLRESGQHRIAEPAAPALTREVDSRTLLLALRDELSGLLESLDCIVGDGVVAPGDQAPAQEEAAHEGTATSTVRVPHPARRPSGD
jgi:DNA-binding transcriptional MerR regulator